MTSPNRVRPPRAGQAVGLEVSFEARREIVYLRRDEPWFPEAAAAFERDAKMDEDWSAMEPLFYGRWDAAARAHSSEGETQTNEDVTRGFAAEGAFDPTATRAQLAEFGSPVLVFAGGVDPQWPPRVAGQIADAFPAARFVVQPGAGHYPWLDDPEWFVATVTEFLAGA